MLRIATALAIVCGVLGLLDFDRYITAVLTFAVGALVLVSTPNRRRGKP